MEKEAIKTPANLYKLAVFLQILDKLHLVQDQIIKGVDVEDLCYLFLNRHPLRPNELPNTVTELIRKVEELLPDINRISKK